LTVVIDANVLAVLALDRRRGAAVERLLRAWRSASEELHAPALMPYEVANAFARAVAAGQLPAEDVPRAWSLVGAIPVVLHQLEDGPAAVELAGQLDRQTAYDASYLLLARQLGVERWTLDGSLARNSQARGFAVNLIEA
jgi:predicted nucleic acid-binding protein